MRPVWKFAALALVGACNQRAVPPRAPLSNAAPPAVRGPRLEWAPSEAAAFARARATHRGVIAETFAAWSMPDVEIDKILHDDGVADQLGGWIAYKVDLTQGDDDPAIHEWIIRHTVVTTPFVGFYDESGEEIERVDGYMGRDDFLRRVPAR
jgi:thiol:disulfide interchange protein